MDNEKNFTVVKYAVKDSAMIEYLTHAALLSNNLTNVNIYHHRQWFFYTQNLYYQENPKEDFKPYKYDSELIQQLKEYMISYNAKRILKGKKEVDFVKFGLDAYFLHYYFKQIDQPDYNHSEISAQMSQQITSKVAQAFKAFVKARIDYFEHPEKYEACPELPRYNKKNSIASFYFTNQDTKINIEFCLENNVSKLALGKNKGWKQECDNGKENNQNFIQIPYTNLYQKITDKLTKHGIEVIEQEESYTSQASAIDLDHIPVYGDYLPAGSFSGIRYGKHNRLYKSKDGITINADMNGALNILRKAFPRVEVELNELQYLKNPQVLTNMQA